jgi:tetratricopeptide (TPR) repeat protein
MSILGKIFQTSGGKPSARLKQVERMLDQDKLADASELLSQAWAERTEETSSTDSDLLRMLRFKLFSAQVAKGNVAEALELAELIKDDDPQRLPELADAFEQAQVIELPALYIVREVALASTARKNMLLKAAKALLSKRGEAMSEDETSFMVSAAQAFPLWKEGQGLLADRFLREGRRDENAVTVYRNAYPNRKADTRLREMLLTTLVATGATDDFAASVYKDAVETSEHPEALRLLAEHYVSSGDITSATISYITRAMEKTKLSEASLQTLATHLLAAEEPPFDRLPVLLSVYRQGYSDRNLLSFLSDKLAEAGKFDDVAIDIMTHAFEQKVVTKRAILILAEHCLANERDDDFAVKVFETYLSTWPDRPQRRIYATLAHHYADLTRVDDQAQKIYQEALVDNPTDPQIVRILARAYHAVDRRDETAEMIYRQAFPQVDGGVKSQLALVLAEMRVGANDFSQETLMYLTASGRPSAGPLAARYDEALTNCFLAAGRRGEQAQEAYFNLFTRTEDSADLNPRLIALLAELIKERGTPPERGSVEMRVYRKLFELEKFSTDPEVAFVLLEDALRHGEKGAQLINLAVLCFEADADRLIKVARDTNSTTLLQEIGDFYIERHNFDLASKAFVILANFEAQPSDQIRYRLAKIHLLEGKPELALKSLEQLKAPEFTGLREYWQMAALQQQHQPDKAQELLDKLTGDGIPKFLLELRQAINLELKGELDAALRKYESLTTDPLFVKFGRWIQLERGIVMMRKGSYAPAREHLEEVYRLNSAGRAEQLLFSLALFFVAHSELKQERIRESLPLFTRAVEVNRNHRALRQVIVDILSLYGERAFFKGDLQRAAEVLEVAHRILPKRMETKILLAYTYHRLKDFPKAIIYYRDIVWTDDNPQLERSQAYAYMENGKPEKAWRVFYDLAKRGNLSPDDFSRTVLCFLQDQEAAKTGSWSRIDFSDMGGLPLVALLMHDGEFERAAAELSKLIAQDASNPQLYWYLGKAHSQLGKRDMAVHSWKKLLELCMAAGGEGTFKQRQLTEIGLAFLEAGYAQEAVQTWAQLRQLDEKNPDLAPLYAATLDLNAYQMARKDQLKLAAEEWKKALAYDPESAAIQQNFAIVTLLRDDYDEAIKQYTRLAKLWQRMIDSNPRQYAHLARLIGHLEKVINTLGLTKDRPEFDLTKVRAEDTIEFYQKANQFYWILSLEKGATPLQIEHEYFRLIKIFNPERHADDFMLVEESYTNLYKQPERRALLDLFVFNPVDITTLRSRLTSLKKDGQVSFERLDLQSNVPPPDFSQMQMRKVSEDELVAPLQELLAISFKIPDWTML